MSLVDSSSALCIQALGRPFTLGMLYDARSDNLIPGVTLWSPEKLRMDSQKVDQKTFKPYTNTSYTAEDSFTERVKLLDISAGIKMSLAGGLITVEGSAHYLNASTKSDEAERFTMRYTTETEFVQLTMNQLGRGNVDYPTVFDDGTATHVVTGIVYGGDAVFVFDRRRSSDEGKSEVQGALKAAINAIPNISIEGHGGVMLNDAEKSRGEKISAVFYGDVHLDVTPTSYVSAIKAYMELPSKFAMSHVPKKIYLYPLALLDSRASKLVRQISDSLVDAAGDIIDHLKAVSCAAATLMASPTLSYFPGVRQQLIAFATYVGRANVAFQSALCQTLPRVRGGGAEEQVLVDLISSFQRSPLDKAVVAEWLRKKSQEVNLLQQFINNMRQAQHVKVANSSDEIDRLTASLDLRFVVVLCYQFCNANTRYLTALDTWSVNTTTAFDATGPSGEWVDNAALRSQIRLVTKHFLDFADIHKDNADVVFAVVDDSLAKTEGASVHVQLYDSGVPNAFHPPSAPTKLRTTSMHTESVELGWTAPVYGQESLIGYTLLYRKVQDEIGTLIGAGEWAGIAVPPGEASWGLLKLSSGCHYEVKMRGETVVGEGPTSSSLRFLTPAHPRLADAILARSTVLQVGMNGAPSIYQVPFDREVEVDERQKILRKSIGNPVVAATKQSKVLLVMGESGAGKTTTINAMINYLFGVRYEDNFRFQLLTDKEDTGHTNQAKSKTKYVTAYTIYWQPGSAVDITLVLVDTPGFNDTDGRDEVIRQQIKYFFKMENQYRVDEIHAVTLVAPSSQARLTVTQKYIIDSVLSTFGVDVEDNFAVMMTFADGQPPPLEQALKLSALKVRDDLRFKINNSALYAANSGTGATRFDELFWEMLQASFSSFFTRMQSLKTKSLALTRQQLTVREQLQAIAADIPIKIAIKTNQLASLDQQKMAIKNNYQQIIANENWKYTEIESKVRVIDLPVGQFVTNCLKCQYTCHFPCAIALDQEKHGCAAMDGQGHNSVCTVCPKKCHWTEHHNNPNRFEHYTERVIKTYENLKRLHNVAVTGKDAAIQLLRHILTNVVQTEISIFELMIDGRKKMNLLQEIALRPNYLTQVDYIDQLITAEETTKQAGWSARVKAYREARTTAVELEKIRNADEQKIVADLEEAKKVDVEEEVAYLMLVLEADAKGIAPPPSVKRRHQEKCVIM